jgi:hypothetical protein
VGVTRNFSSASRAETVGVPSQWRPGSAVLRLLCDRFLRYSRQNGFEVPDQPAQFLRCLYPFPSLYCKRQKKENI